MPDETEKKLLTLERKDGVIDPADEAVIQAAATGQGLIAVTPDQIVQLAKAAGDIHDYFLETAKVIITKERADYVRKLRVDDGYSWRAVAHACYDEWQGDWGPPSNQLMGMSLCEIAAGFFGEHYMQEPWN
jgi:hypothetical protein